MKKIIIISLISLISLITVPFSVIAVDSNISEDDIKEKIKERLEEVVDKGLEKVKGVMEEEKKSKLYAWVGIIESVSEKKMSIKTIDGLKEAKAASNAAIFKLVLGKSKKSVDAEDIEKGQFIISMGPKEEEIILAKRIILMDEAPTPVKREIISGKVKEVDETKVTIQKNGETEVLTIAKKAKLTINSIKKPTVEDIQINDYLTAIVVLDKEDNLDEVKAVLIIPGETNPQAEENEVKEEETATPAAEAEEEDKEQ